MGFNTLLSVSSQPIGDTISIAILIVLAVFVVFEMLQGLRRGVFKQGLHIVCTIEAAVLSFVAVSGLAQGFMDAFDVATVEELLAALQQDGSSESLVALAQYLEGVDWLIVLPIGTILAPVFFTLFFILTSIGAKIMYPIMKKVLDIPKKAKGAAQRCSGMAVGAVEGLLVFSIFMLPFVGTVALVDDGVTALREKDPDSYEEMLEKYDENIAPIADNVAFATVRAIGGDSVLNAFATVRADGEKINLREEIVSAVSIGAEISTLGEVDFKNLTPEQQKTISSAVDTLGESEYLSIIASGLLRGAATALNSGVIPFDSIEPPFDILVNSVISLFETSTKDNIDDDLHSVLGIYYILCDDGVLSAIEGGDSDAMTDLLVKTDENGKTVINKIIEMLKQNDHTKPLIKTLTELSISLVSSQLGLGEDSTEVYNNVKEGLNDVLSINPADYEDTEEGKAQYKQDLTNTLDTTLKENGIELEPEIVEGIADYIDQNIEVKDECTDEDVNEIILSYYDVYVKYQQTGELPEGFPGGGASDTEGGEGSTDAPSGGEGDATVPGGDLGDLGDIGGILDDIIGEN